MKNIITAGAIVLTALALVPNASALGASAGASAGCFSSPNPYTGTLDYYPTGSYSASASATLLDIGASLVAWGSGMQAVSKADAGQWPAKLSASASGYAGELGPLTPIAYGTTVTFEAHSTASSALSTPLVANDVATHTCL